MRRKHLHKGRSLTAGIALLLCFTLAASRQLAAEPPLRIVIVEGEGALNDMALERARPPRVRIDDASGHPIPGAAVTFALPDMGPGGAFDGGGLTLAVKSDIQGIAVGQGLRPNNVAGPFQIHVSASHQGGIASAVVNQTNVATRHRAEHNRLPTALLLGAAVGGGIAIVVATRGRGSRAPAPLQTTRPTIIPTPVPTVRAFTPSDVIQILDSMPGPSDVLAQIETMMEPSEFLQQ